MYPAKMRSGRGEKLCVGASKRSRRGGYIEGQGGVIRYVRRQRGRYKDV